MRIRTIKPEFWTDRKIGDLSRFARLFFIGLWSVADDSGRGPADVARLASALFPFDLRKNPAECYAETQKALDELVAAGRVTLYDVDGELFFEVPAWPKHQRIDRPSRSNIPQRVADDSTRAREDASRAPRGLDEGSSQEQGTGNREGNREQGMENTPQPPKGEDPVKAHKVKDLGDDVPLSDTMRSDRLDESWGRWKRFRRGLKSVKDWRTLFEGQARYLARFPEPVAFEMLEQSIRNGWQGLFEVKGGLNGGNGANGRNGRDRNGGTHNVATPGKYAGACVVVESPARVSSPP